MTAFAAALFLAAKKDIEAEARMAGIHLPDEDHREFITELHEELKQDRCHGSEVAQNDENLTLK